MTRHDYLQTVQLHVGSVYSKYIVMKSKRYPFTGLTGQVIFFVNLEDF